MDFVSSERQQMIATFQRVGADAPTLCEGWNSEDLLRHLIMREVFPHVAALSKLPLKFADSSRERQEQLANASYAELIEIFRDGRQKYSPLNVSAVDKAFNTLEYVIHHEDLRRAQDPPLGRILSTDEQKTIFSSLKGFAQILYAKAPVEIVLQAPGFGEFRAFATKRHDRTVTITGAPLELAMYSFGRDADVELDGLPDDVQRVDKMTRGG